LLRPAAMLSGVLLGIYGLAAAAGAQELARQDGASGQSAPEAPIEMRVQRHLESNGLAATTLRLKPMRAHLRLEQRLAPEEAEALAGELFALLPEAVTRVWLAWPQAQGRGARLYLRGRASDAPVGTNQAEGLLEALTPFTLKGLQITGEGRIAPLGEKADTGEGEDGQSP